MVCAQRRSTRAATLAPLALAMLATGGVIAVIATSGAAMAAVITAPLTYLLRRLFDA
jgi:hypothetical protein